MAGARRTAAVTAALLLLTAAFATADSPAQHVLRPGTAVVFVTDSPLAPDRREGDVVSVHLRDALVLDGTTVAAPGTRAEILIGRIINERSHEHVYSLEHFVVGAGLLPVVPARPIVPPLAAGTEIPARTAAEVDHLGDRVSIRIPFPFRLGGDTPASAYTPTPARTAPPYTFGGRGAPRSPTPAPSPTASPAPSGTMIPSR